MTNSDTAAMLAPASTLTIRLKGQKSTPKSTKSLPTFDRNLEEVLDVRRASSTFFTVVGNDWQTSEAVDFSSNDILSFNADGHLRIEFLAELASQPDFSIGSGGSRLMDGNYPYIEKTEREIAAFHGAETGLIVGSGFEANLAVWSAVPRPGDVILYDSLVHASTHEGMDKSLALQKIEFEHNDTESFRQNLVSILDSQVPIRQGRRSVLVAVESVYSVDGDVCPLQDLVDIAKEILHEHGNIQFVIDEAHSTGILGPKGAGLVCHLGLEEDIAVRVHTFGKAMGSSGAIILGNETVRRALVNLPRSVIFTTAPSFPFVAAIRAGYTLLDSSKGKDAQDRVQYLARLFFETMTSHPAWERSVRKGLISVPLSSEWEERAFFTHIVTIFTRPEYLYWLYFHLLSSSYCAWPVHYPTVPFGKGRIKVTLHACNSDKDVQGLVSSLFEWIEQISNIEERKTEAKVTKAAAEVYAWMRREGLSGFGMVQSV